MTWYDPGCYRSAAQAKCVTAGIFYGFPEGEREDSMPRHKTNQASLVIVGVVALLAIILTLILKPSGLFGRQKELEERV